MASATLQNLIPPDAPARLASMLSNVWPGFDTAAFVAQAALGFEQLGLMARGRQLAEALHRHLPPDYPHAVGLLVKAMGPPMGLDARGEPVAVPGAPGGFFYLPHSLYIAAQGLDHLAVSMQAQHALAQRFTAEFSLRPYLETHPAATLRHLAGWAGDPSAHVRRAVSEGTRPRLPWAPRLAAFVTDPGPVLPLLERLRDDPSSYVRRSVGNHLNDIGKDHPALLLALAARWLDDAPPERRKLVRHALRSLVKRGDPQALALLGHGAAVRLELRGVKLEPRRPAIGGAVTIEVELRNPGRRPVEVLADLRVHYVKARGQASAKVFRLRALQLPAGGSERMRKRLSLAQMSTRVHHPGRHEVELLLNGRPQALGHFDLRAAKPPEAP